MPRIEIELNWRPAKKPERAPLVGDSVLLEPLDVARHGEELYTSSAGADSTWDYLPYGPFAGKSEFMAWLEQRAPMDDPLTFTIIDRAAFEAWLAPANFDPSGVQRRSLAEVRGE